MRLFQVVCTCLLAVIARAQELQNCSADAVPLTIGSTEDVGTLATSILGCLDGAFAVQWVGEVVVEDTIRITGGTSLNITGAGPGAIADGRNDTQLFVVDQGSSLHFSDMTFAHGNASTGDGGSNASTGLGTGGAIFVSDSVVFFSGNTSFISNSAGYDGGAIYACNSTVSWDGDGVEFVSNSAEYGGAIYAFNSTVLAWEGGGTEFISNSAGYDGGAVYACNSTVSWDGDGAEFVSNSAEYGGAIFACNSTVLAWEGGGTEFISNSAEYSGGAIYAWGSTVSWDGDGAEFVSNSAGYGGGAIYAGSLSVVAWEGDGTEFISNSVWYHGGAIYAWSSTVSWDGSGTEFISNSAGEDGGAIYAWDSTVSWDGAGTEFTSNSAGFDGGAMFMESSTISLDKNTTFTSNTAWNNGGALVVTEQSSSNGYDPVVDTAFINNSAGSTGGAAYFLYCEGGLNFTDVIFESNSAGTSGGAIAAVSTGSEHFPATYTRCTFLNNKADGSGGAIETLSGRQEVTFCVFEGNSADAGGAMILGGTGLVSDCYFASNSAASRGFAVSLVASANNINISRASFDSNELYCKAGSYRQDSEEEEPTARYEKACLDCPDWDACHGCTILRSDVTPTCEVPLEHTSADADGVTLEMLNIDGGYWRATTDSGNILACYNADACSGGVTGADSFCASGYTGPYCAVCQTDFSTSPGRVCTRCSSSRRQGLMAVTVIAALVVILAVVAIFKYLLSTEVEEGNTGWFRRRVLGAVPVQALKIIVVVWQILTQFADAAQVTYPGVYQDFLGVIDFINFDLGSVLAAGCLWTDIDFHDRLLVSTLGPLVAIGFLAMTYRIAVCRNGAPGDDAAVVAKIFHKHLTALLLLTFLVYSSVSSAVFQTFACETLDDGIEYLRADYRVHCTDAEHKAFEVYAGIMVLVYPVGIPLLYAALLFQRRDVLADAGADKAKAQSIAGLWEPYRPDRFYYEVVECGRRVLLTGVVVFIFPSDSAQIAITMLIAFFFLVLFEILSPYKSETDMWLSRGGHVIVFLSMFDLLLLKVDVSGERDQSQAAFAGVLVAGHVLMILAIVVEVVVICCGSAGKLKGVVGGVSESLYGSSSPVGSDDVPVFENPPASWSWFTQKGSVSEKTGPTRSISDSVVR